MATKISKRVGYDSMTISGKMMSGASVKLTINRNGERLESALSNDPDVAGKQLATLTSWLKLRKGESNEDRFDRLEKVLNLSENSTEFINNLKTH